MKISAIIPVKTFSKAKTRLNLPAQKKDELCRLMLEEVLSTICTSKIIDEIVVVSKDDNALEISKRYDAVQIFDHDESGVNNAVALADAYIKDANFDASVVFPQDIPFIEPQDIDNLFRFQNSSKSVIVVPSRRFDGTNALVRRPVNLMKTHYDEDSYKIHLDVGKSCTPSTSMLLIRRIMLDVDNQEDLEYVIAQTSKPTLVDKIRNLSN